MVSGESEPEPVDSKGAAERRKEREWSERLFSEAAEFHGHGGPFLAIGLRMGLSALKRLDALGWFDLRCRALLPLKTPESCIVDGIQFSTGCTIGKRNIELRRGDGVKAEFIKSGKHLRLALKDEALKRVRELLADGSEKALLDWIAEAEESELFIIEN